MRHRFRLVVIGSGVAGATVAYRCRRESWTVAVVDSHPFGGTCELRGCDPKKVLMGAADAIDAVRRLKGAGIDGDVRLDWASLMRFKRTFTDPVPQKSEAAFAKVGIATYHGRARFVEPLCLQVGDDMLEAEHVVIAAGSKPAPLPIEGADSLTFSDQFLNLETFPQKLLFIGGGFISLEFAHVAARAGAEATILEMTPRILPRFDPDLVAMLAAATQDAGIGIETGAQVQRMERQNSRLLVTTSAADGVKTRAVDMVVHGAGRIPDIEDMGLETIGVARNAQGVAVNEYLQSVTQPAVFAAGDAASTQYPQLTPVAMREGEIVAENLLHGNRLKVDSPAAAVIFTLPPLASVGLTEESARARGLRFRVHFEETSSWYSSRRIREKHSGAKVLLEEGTGRIIGAHLLGRGAEELINVFALAMEMGLDARNMHQPLFAYPTMGSNIAYLV